MNILWFTWKDLKNPAAGGAELINEELAAGLVKDGHQVKFLTANFKLGKPIDYKKGFRIIRVGNRFTVYWQAYRYFKKYLQDWPDLIIEEINTIPFFTQFYAKQKKVLIFYQLCREIWFYQFPFPLSLFGFLFEPLYLKLLSKNKVLTESESTKKDLLQYGFNRENTFIFPVGISSPKSPESPKSPGFTLLSFGAIRSMKRIDHQIKAFDMAKSKIPGLKLVIAGNAVSSYGEKISKKIKLSAAENSITFLGKVKETEKLKLMSQCHLLLVTSIKEGWCLVVTEANSQKTPAIVYNVDGLRDSVKDGITGIICKNNNPEELAKNIVKLYQNKSLYKKLQKNAWNYSKIFTLDRSYQEFKKYAKIS